MRQWQNSTAYHSVLWVKEGFRLVLGRGISEWGPAGNFGHGSSVLNTGKMAASCTCALDICCLSPSYQCAGSLSAGEDRALLHRDLLF